MGIPSSVVSEILEANEINSLHHANSVATACQFLRSKSLMSRGTVERRGGKQTPQKSDAGDKLSGLWFDVFVDTVDIHGRASTLNVYGPVLFVLNSDILKKSYTGSIWVTKLNPTKWKGKSRQDRWFQSKDDLELSFKKGRFDHMIVFRHTGGELPFRNCLQEIILDDPRLETADGVDFYSMAHGALRLAMSDGGLDVPIRKRKCAGKCSCVRSYQEGPTRFDSFFDPYL